MNPVKTSPPRLIKRSGCVAQGIDLQADRYGNEYLRLGSFGSTQLATRQVGRGFSEAVRLNPNWGDGRSEMVVSNNGLATVIFGSSARRTGYGYVTSRWGGTPSAPKKLDTRTGLSDRRDALLGVAPLPRGRIAMFWAEIWPKGKEGSGWRRLGVKVWHPKQAFRRPAYSVELPPRHTAFPAGIEAGRTGSRIAWWQLVEGTAAPGKRVFWLGP